MVGFEDEAVMNKLAGTVCHRKREIAELAADRELAIAYVKADGVA